MGQSFATNTPDHYVLVPQEDPGPHARVTNKVETSFYFYGPYSTEGPVSEKGMHEARKNFPSIYVDRGWWEKIIIATTRVSEKVDFDA